MNNYQKVIEAQKIVTDFENNLTREARIECCKKANLKDNWVFTMHHHCDELHFTALRSRDDIEKIESMSFVAKPWGLQLLDTGSYAEYEQPVRTALELYLGIKHEVAA